MKTKDLYKAAVWEPLSGEELALFSRSLASQENAEYEQDGEPVPPNYPIPPIATAVRGTACGRFGSAEMEWVAWAIVVFSRAQGAWNPFTREQIEVVFLQQHPKDVFAFEQMRVRGVIFSRDNGQTFQITTRFIELAQQR